MARERTDGGLTLGEILFVVGILGFTVLALVALVLGRPGIAAIIGFCALALFGAGTSPFTNVWGHTDNRWSMSEADFEDLVEGVERQASDRPGSVPRDPHDPDDFAALIQEALDELPEFMQDELRENLAVSYSDDGVERGLYGLYEGGTVARDDFAHHITIFRDTLLRDFGDDPGELRRQVTTTVRHELAHHLGADEGHVRDLGL